MIGGVVVMTPSDYARWSAAQPQGDTLADQGRRLFVSMGCSGCHGGAAVVRAPNLTGLYGKPVQTTNLTSSYWTSMTWSVRRYG